MPLGMMMLNEVTITSNQRPDTTVTFSVLLRATRSFSHQRRRQLGSRFYNSLGVPI